jgi:hypothetical protein
MAQLGRNRGDSMEARAVTDGQTARGEITAIQSQKEKEEVKGSSDEIEHDLAPIGLKTENIQSS